MWRCPVAWVAAATILTVCGVAVEPASAIPAFARKYDVSCFVCHIAEPKLNDFGQWFRDRGYRMGGEADDPARHDEGFWPVSLRSMVGYRNARITHQPFGSGDIPVKTGGAGFTGMDVLSYGTLGRNIAFGLVYTPDLRRAGFAAKAAATDSDLESAWVRLSARRNGAWPDLKIGMFELDLPFSEHRSLTPNTPYVVYHYQAGVPYAPVLPNSAPKAYASSSNSFGLGDNQPGAEVFGAVDGLGGTFRYALAGVTNNTADVGGRDVQFYGHLTQSFGGWGATQGHRVGAFAFLGRAPTSDPTAGTIAGAGQDGADFSRLGVDASTTLGTLNLIGVYLRGEDDRRLIGSTAGTCPALPCATQNAAWTGGFVEFNYAPRPDVVGVYRYDVVRNTRQGDVSAPTSYNDVDSHTAGVRYALLFSTRTMTWAHLEYNRTRTTGTGVAGQDTMAQTWLAGFDFAF